MPDELTRRAVQLPADREFLITVYASTRADELALTQWSDEQRAAFVRMQYDARERHYAAAFTNAHHEIIEVRGAPAGQLIVDRPGDEIRIVDLALLPAFRNAGVGTRLMRPLLAEADAAAVPIRCHAIQGRPEQRFWERLGLIAGLVDGVHVSMERPCATSRR